MNGFLNNIRAEEPQIALNKKIINTVAIMLLGVALGVFSKFLDTTPTNELPLVLGYLDVGNFLGRLAIWILFALCIAVYSNSSMRAGINVFAFFAGMVTSYYLYTKYVAGFFPKSYAMIWIGFTLVSPFMAFVCWYAKGKSKAAFALSVMILSVLFNATFVYGWSYFEVRSVLELAAFIVAFIVLRRNTLKGSALMGVFATILAFLLNALMPFHFG